MAGIIRGSGEDLWTLYQRDVANLFAFRQSRPAVPPGGTVQVVGEDYDRRYLLISNPTAGNVFVNLPGAGSATTGRVLVSTLAPWELWWDVHGPLVCQAWVAGGPMATTLYVVELVLSSEGLGLEDRDESWPGTDGNRWNDLYRGLRSQSE